MMGYTNIMTDEIWADIAGYDGAYQISNMGHVRTFLKKDGFVGFVKTEKSRPRSLISHGNGYMYVTLCKNGVRKNHYIHRLVAEAFIGEIKDGYVINHLDYDRSNNRVENLEIVSQKDNVDYSKHKMKKPVTRKGNYYICDRGTRYEVYVKKKYLGSYKTIEEARTARNEYINKINYY